MKEQEKLFSQLKKSIEFSDVIKLVVHRKPDADTLGSAFAMRNYLLSLGKEVFIISKDGVPEDFSFFPSIEGVFREFEVNEGDLFIFLDLAADYMTGFDLDFDLLNKENQTFNIDHHSSNNRFANVNIVGEFASTTALIFIYLDYVGFDFDADTATYLIAGLYSDTGSFKHSNVDALTFDIAHKLMLFGAKIEDITKDIFNTNTVSQLKIWGRIFERIVLTDEGAVYSFVNSKDIADLNCDFSASSGVVEYLNMIPNTNHAILFTQMKNLLKASLRSKNGFDVAEYAAKFGGGGHREAAGFTVKGDVSKSLGLKIENPDMSKKSFYF